MNRHALRILGIALTVALSACYQESSYIGDGRLIDNGWQLKGGRYAVDLGPIDISRAGEYAYVLRGLPDAELAIGIELVEAVPNRGHRPNHQADIRLELKESEVKTIVSESGSLESWVWSYGLGDTKSFLYRRGESREIALSGGATKNERIVNSSGGWGSHFTADDAMSYQLTLQVINSATPQRPARLILRSVSE